MKIKINKEKLAARLQSQQDKASSKKRDPKDSIILKVSEPGEHNFRGTYYPHNEDPSVEPFAERYYHYGFPGGTFYCPQKNCGEECYLCDFVWERLKDTKGTPAAKEWSKKLPKMSMLIPGLARGREDEGCKFLRVGTREDKPSKNYTKIYGWFAKDDVCEWLDPDVGYDIVLSYAEPDESQSQYLHGAKAILDSMDLARKDSKFGTKKEFEAFMGKVPDIDVDVFPKKSTQDSLDVLNKFHEILSKKAARSGLKAPEVTLNKSEGTSVKEAPKPAATDSDALDGKLSDLGL